jgi:hypothetical protein
MSQNVTKTEREYEGQKNGESKYGLFALGRFYSTGNEDDGGCQETIKIGLDKLASHVIINSQENIKCEQQTKWCGEMSPSWQKGGGAWVLPSVNKT